MGAYEYRESGIEWLGKIPRHWKIDRLKDHLHDDLGAINEKQLSLIPEVHHYSIPAFDENESPEVCAGSAVASGKKVLHDQGLLYSKLNCWKPRVWQYDVSEVDTISVASTEFIGLRPTPSSVLLSDYLRYLLSSQAFTERVKIYLSAVTNSHQRISPNTFLAQDVPLPPLEEQQAIAAYLDQACTKIDAAIAIKREQLTQLETIEKTITNKATLEGINETAPTQKVDSTWFNVLPAHWTLRRLKDVSDMQTGITLGKDFDEATEERPYMRVANVQDGHLALDNMKTIRLPPRLIPRYELRSGDVLMTEGGDLDKLGRGYVWHGQIEGCLHQNHVFALRCYPHKLLPDYLALLTSSTHGRAYFEIMGKKTTNLASINSTKVNLFPVPLPPLEEQHAIVDWVSAKRDKLQQAKIAVSEQIAVLEKYRKSLIHECVTGKKQVFQYDN